MAKAKNKKRKLGTSMPKIKWLKRKIADKYSIEEQKNIIIDEDI